MKNKYLRIGVTLCVFLVSFFVYAQDLGLSFSKMVHDFGTFSVDSGKKSCTFDFKNNTNKPIVINNILSSCGCTTPKWPKKPIMPGETGVIDVVYDNDLGPYPFDKSLTVYTSASSKPIMLRITGVPVAGNKSLKQQFPSSYGPLGTKKSIIAAGQFEQGDIKEKSFILANTSNKKVQVKFDKITPGLTFSKPIYDIEANGVITIDYKINTNSAKYWGNTTYTANIICNGQNIAQSLKVSAMIIEPYSDIPANQKNNSSMLTARNSSINLGDIPQGKPVNVSFDLINTGKKDLIIYKAECEGVKADIKFPDTIAVGKDFKLIVNINTQNIEKGKDLVCTITLITNSPNRPLVNLFIIGKIV